MDCFFKNINRVRCNSFLRCEGIYKVCKEMGTSEEFANSYSKYILKLSVLHKLRDKQRDYQIKGIFSRFKHFLLKSIYILYRRSFRDTYHLERYLDKTESSIEKLEKEPDLSDPMIYFKKSGEAYGLIFKYASLNAKNQSNETSDYRKFGNLIGTLVSLNDSIKDLKKDRKNGQFNPFKYWKRKEINLFYKQNISQIKEELRELTIKKKIDNNLKINPLKMENNNIATMLKTSISASLLAVPFYPALINPRSGFTDACTQFMSENWCCVCGVISVIIILGAGCIFACDKAGIDCY
ncbi:MAG: hypothetical protein GF317_03305 [Candidatus Lokiarchaeota archaeon]|nr:hypothetical protein [Candidatus Lokiarchaeota archaeon]MBD3198931.1 hypothetical protein [Candidatus Lokiarchaeota archaeon]